MGGAYGEWTYRAPPGSSCTSGGTALPPATPVGQICTMYIDFPLDGNTPNPRIKFLKRRLGFGEPPPDTPEAPGGPWRPRDGPETLDTNPKAPSRPPEAPWRVLEAPQGPLEPPDTLEAPETPTRVLEAGFWRPLEGRGPLQAAAREPSAS